MNKSLITLINEATELENLLVLSGGEITPEIESKLIVKDITIPQKIDSYSFILERFDSLEEHYKSKAQFYSQIAKQCGQVTDRLKNNIKYTMQELETTELRGEDIRFKLQVSKPKVVVENESLLPKKYKTEVITTVIDKEVLRLDLEAMNVEGAKLEPSFSLKKYANNKGK